MPDFSKELRNQLKRIEKPSWQLYCDMIAPVSQEYHRQCELLKEQYDKTCKEIYDIAVKKTQ